MFFVSGWEFAFLEVAGEVVMISGYVVLECFGFGEEGVAIYCVVGFGFDLVEAF